MSPRRIPRRHLRALDLRAALPSCQGSIPCRLPLQRLPPSLQSEEGKGLPSFLLHAVEVGQDRRWASSRSRRFVLFSFLRSSVDSRLTDIFLLLHCSPSSRFFPSRRPRILLRARYLRSEGEGHLARRASNSEGGDDELAIQTSHLGSRDLPFSPDRSSYVLLHRRPSHQHLGPRRNGQATLDA